MVNRVLQFLQNPELDEGSRGLANDVLAVLRKSLEKNPRENAGAVNVAREGARKEREALIAMRQRSLQVAQPVEAVRKDEGSTPSEAYRSETKGLNFFPSIADSSVSLPGQQVPQGQERVIFGAVAMPHPDDAWRHPYNPHKSTK
jgi:hypothetical protein